MYFLQGLVWVCSAILLYFAGGHEEETARSLEDRIRINVLEQQSTKNWEKFSKGICRPLE